MALLGHVQFASLQILGREITQSLLKNVVQHDGNSFDEFFVSFAVLWRHNRPTTMYKDRIALFLCGFDNEKFVKNVMFFSS